MDCVENFTRLWFYWKHGTLHSLDSSHGHYFSCNWVCVICVEDVFFIDYYTWLYHQSITFECKIVIGDLLAWTYYALIVIGLVIMFSSFFVLRGPNSRKNLFQEGRMIYVGLASLTMMICKSTSKYCSTLKESSSSVAILAI